MIRRSWVAVRLAVMRSAGQRATMGVLNPAPRSRTTRWSSAGSSASHATKCSPLDRWGSSRYSGPLRTLEKTSPPQLGQVGIDAVVSGLEAAEQGCVGCVHDGVSSKGGDVTEPESRASCTGVARAGELVGDRRERGDLGGGAG